MRRDRLAEGDRCQHRQVSDFFELLGVANPPVQPINEERERDTDQRGRQNRRGWCSSTVLETREQSESTSHTLHELGVSSLQCRKNLQLARGVGERSSVRGVACRRT